MSSCPTPDIGSQEPVIRLCKLNARAADLWLKIMNKMGTWNLRGQIPRPRDVPKSLLEDVNAALLTIPTATITRTNKLAYTAATVILEMLGYGIKTKSSPNSPWKMGLEAKIKTTRREVSHWGRHRKVWSWRIKWGYWESTRDCHHLRSWRLLSKCSQHWQVDWGIYTKEAEAKINALFPKEPSKVHCQLQCKTIIRPEPPKAETERYWKTIWEDEKTHNIDAQWLQELRTLESPRTGTNHSSLSSTTDQENKEQAPDPDMSHTYWLKNSRA